MRLVKKDSLKINFLASDAERKARRSTVIVAGIFTLFVGILSAVGAGASYQAASRGVSVFSDVGSLFSFAELKRLVWNDGNSGSGQDPFATSDGNINILFLGIGGEGHDGSQLTDTIILASFNREQGKLGLVSVPRDLAYPLGGGRYEKINSVNAYEELDHPGEGAARTKDAFAKLFDTRIDRVVKVDFKGFESFIDALDGIDVTVEKTFTDHQFPTEDNGPNPYKWTSVSFTKGVEHMDGRRALTYARSRHAAGGEGSDFARSRRQHLVIKAIRERLLSLGTLSNPKTISDLWTAVSSHVQTDFTAWDVLKLVPSVTKFSDIAMTNQVLTDDVSGELVAGNVDGAFMLFPRKSDWSEIRTIVRNPFESKQKATEEQKAKGIAVEIRNGTNRTGFAAQVSALLESSGYLITGTGNAQHRTYERTVIYDLTNGTKLDELAKLKKMFDANVAATDGSKQIVLTDGSRENLSTSSAQFLVILGNSSLSLVTNYAVTQTP